MKTTKIVFLEHNPFMSVELLDLIKDYKILCFNDDSTYRYIKDKWDISSYLNKEFYKEPESDKVAEILLSDEKFLNDAIRDKKESKIIFFYMNSRMDELTRKAGLSMVLPSFNLQEKLGSKVFLSSLCEKLNIPQNQNIVFDDMPENIQKTFLECEEKLGLPFIVQGGQGESGWDTSLIYTRDDFDRALAKTEKGLRIARYIKNNIPISINVCITEDEIIIRGPWLQLIGLPELSAGPFRFTGNDTNQSLLDSDLIENVRETSLKVSKFAKTEGYRGILGIDYLWDKESKRAYPQEINSRLAGSTRLLTGIQKDQSLMPDLIKHIQSFANIRLSKKASLLREGELNLITKNYSQVIVRHNVNNPTVVRKRMEPGIYRITENQIKRVSSSLFVEEMTEDDVLITAAIHKDCVLSTGEVLVRLILKKSVVRDDDYKLTDEASNLVKQIRDHILES